MRSALFVAALAVLAGCKSNADPPPQTTTTVSGKHRQTPVPTGPMTTKVTAFAVDAENLKVDKIAMRDGSVTPDGNRDLAFTATVEGPVDALYLVTCDEKGTPHYVFRADTISGHEELPSELGGVVDVGRLTVWIAVVENNKWNNAERASLSTLASGPHSLRLYVPNTGNLLAGSHLRLYARAPGGALAAGPVVSY